MKCDWRQPLYLTKGVVASSVGDGTKGRTTHIVMRISHLEEEKGRVIKGGWCKCRRKIRKISLVVRTNAIKAKHLLNRKNLEKNI